MINRTCLKINSYRHAAAVTNAILVEGYNATWNRTLLP